MPPLPYYYGGASWPMPPGYMTPYGYIAAAPPGARPYVYANPKGPAPDYATYKLPARGANDSNAAGAAGVAEDDMFSMVADDVNHAPADHSAAEARDDSNSNCGGGDDGSDGGNDGGGGDGGGDGGSGGDGSNKCATGGQAFATALADMLFDDVCEQHGHNADDKAMAWNKE